MPKEKNNVTSDYGSHTETDRTREEQYCLFFSGIEGLGNVQMDVLMETFGSAKDAFKASEAELTGLKQIRKEVVENITERKRNYDAEREYERIHNMGMGYVSRWHPDYPERLTRISNPPNGLFFIGKLPKNNVPAVSIIGSRACSSYGKEMALRFGRGLAQAGIDVISGMAAGVDGYSHRGALNGGGDTFAVLGCGADICYPRENSDIYSRIKEQGGILSEYYPSSKPLSVNFPRRNRIISALSDGILVVEARERSGTWITVDMGLEQQKDIFAIPGRIGDSMSVGCNRLIRNGARLVTDPEDIVAELAPHYGFLVNRTGCGDPATATDCGKGRLTPTERKLYDMLDYKGRSLHELEIASGLDMSCLLATLTMLEIKGFSSMIGNGVYVRADSAHS